VGACKAGLESGATRNDSAEAIVLYWSFLLPFVPLKPADGSHLHSNGPLALTVSLHLAKLPFITQTALYIYICLGSELS
jgi:hypothetical protein